MAQSAGKSRSKPTRNSGSVFGEGELSAQHAYILSYLFLLKSSHVKFCFALALGIGETHEQFLHVHR